MGEKIFVGVISGLVVAVLLKMLQNGTTAHDTESDTGV